MAFLEVYVPRPDTALRASIWPGSAIVGSPHGESGRLRIDFEGDDDVYPTFEDRLRRAAERHLWSDGHRSGYPTRACAYVDEEELIRVGTYDPEAQDLDLEAPEVLDGWLARDEGAPGGATP